MPQDFPTRPLACLLGLTLLTAAFPAKSVAAEAAIRDLGRGVLPTAMSADGSIVVGGLESPSSQSGTLYLLGFEIGTEIFRFMATNNPFRWTSDSGVATNLSGIPNSWWSSGARAVSADGNVVVGQASSLPFRWTASTGLRHVFTDAPIVPSEAAEIDAPNRGVAAGISADGAIIVGQHLTASSDYPNVRAYRWTSGAGVEDLDLLDGFTASAAAGISADGSAIAGTVFNAEAKSRAVRWTAAGAQSLGILPGANNSMAAAISADGSVIVGVSSGRAFRWTEADGMVAVAPAAAFVPRAVSADGSVIVGRVGALAYRWDAAHGLQSLAFLLGGAGVDVSQWSLESATAISADGATIAGTGESPVPRDGFVIMGTHFPKDGWIATGVTGSAEPDPTVIPLADFPTDPAPLIAYLEPSPTPAPGPAPTISSNKSVIRKGKLQVTIKGTAGGSVTKVLYRLASAKTFKVATGTNSWSLSLRLHGGRNFVTVVARGPGGDSAPRTFIIR